MFPLDRQELNCTVCSAEGGSGHCYQYQCDRYVIVFSGEGQDSGQLVESLAGESVVVKTNPAAALLEHVLSMAYQKHIPFDCPAFAAPRLLPSSSIILR